MQYKGTIRQRVEADAPGGFRYLPYANREATVEIRDATDALLARRTVATNAYGSFDGTFQLAAEPTLGNWQIVTLIGEFRTYAQFAVEEYRKPGYTVGVQFSQPHAPGGAVVTATIDARYYFGQPVANAPVQYNISFQPEYNMASSVAPEPPYAGQGVTDAQGRLKLEIRTQRLPIDRRLLIQVSVTDLSRRRQQAEGSMHITAGLFQLHLETDKSVYRAGERMSVTVHAEDYDERPVTTRARVELIEIKYDREHRPYKEKVARDVVTDAAGNGAADFPLVRPGYLTLVAEAFDSDHSPIQATGNVWVTGADADTYDYPTLVLLPDRASYRPGEVATVLLNTSLVTPNPGSFSSRGATASLRPLGRLAEGPAKRRRLRREAERAGYFSARPDRRPVYRRAWALVTVEGERLYTQQLVPIDSRSTALRVPLTADYFPSVEVNVTLLQEKQIYQQQLRLEVRRDEQKLHVSVTPNKDRYRPGETATYTIDDPQLSWRCHFR